MPERITVAGEDGWTYVYEPECFPGASKYDAIQGPPLDGYSLVSKISPVFYLSADFCACPTHPTWRDEPGVRQL